MVQVHSLHAYSLMQTHLVGEFAISSWVPVNIQMHSQQPYVWWLYAWFLFGLILSFSILLLRVK